MNFNLRALAGLRLTRTIVLATPLLGLGSVAQAALVTTSDGKGTIQESPYGLPATSGGAVSSIDLTGKTGQNNFNLTPAGGGTVNVLGASNTTNGGNGSPVVSGSTGNYAAPVTGPSGATLASPYFSTGAYPGSITLTFSQPEKYLGFLWGSIDTVNQLTFSLSDGTTEVITGTQAQAAGPSFGTNGQQTFGGSQYILINFLNGLTFNKVVLSEINSNPNLPSFEAGLFQYAATNQRPLPEPASIALVGIGAGALLIRRRKAQVARQA